MLSETYLYQEILEQPVAMERFLAQEGENLQALARAIQQRGVDHVVIAARGTSDNAGRYAQYVLGAFNGLQVALATPSLFSLYKQPIQFGNVLVLGISQSGQSPDVVAVLAEAKCQGKLTAAITNTPGSPLGEQADFVLHLHAGPEQAVAATKTYTTSLMAIASLSAHLAKDATRLSELERVPGVMRDVLQTNELAKQVAQRLHYMQHCVVLGRGFNYASAFELALKMKELTYSVVEPYSSADFLHGPFAVLEPGFPVIVIAPRGRLAESAVEVIAKLRERSAEVIAISDHPGVLEAASHPLPLPDAPASSLPEWLSPLAAILPGQLLCLHLAHARHLDVDAPRGLNKVTETE